ncbi:MAG TPA: GDSL-type esterase/lipase family protein [Chthonomonadaceae bacterium]|nr:GDSL-type esterase/lipase family protein [Chthonomonadaceae bacterium]
MVRTYWPFAALSAGIAIAGFTFDSTSSARPQRTAQAPPQAKPHDYDHWEKEIAAYEAADRANPPARGGILFIGSSTIRMWNSLAQDFPGRNVINRGFGGSELADSTHFIPRIGLEYEPKQIFLRAGGNDIHAGRPSEEVASDFADFVRTVRARLPDAEIVYITFNPAPSRWSENDKLQKLNALIKKESRRMRRVKLCDAYDICLDANGEARRELFLPDMLHFNAEGYKLLAARVRPFVRR